MHVGTGLPKVPRQGQPRVINRLITRGMGAPRGTGRASLVVYGGGGFRQFIELIKRKAGDGVQYVKEGIDDIVLWAKLVRVNDKKPQQDIQGSVKIKPTHNKISVVTTMVHAKARKAWEDIKITINRIR